MKRFLDEMRSLPDSLVVGACIFLMSPVVSPFLVGWPHRVPGTMAGYVDLTLALLTYYFLPPLLTLSLVYQRQVFLGLFLLEAVLLVTYPITWELLEEGNRPAPLILMVTFSGMGLVMLNRDFFSTVSSAGRRFRKDPRVRMNSLLQIFSADRAKKLPGELEDFSVSGVAIAVSKETLQETLGQVAKGMSLIVASKRAEPTVEIEARIAWIQDAGPLLRLGLHVDDSLFMDRFISVMAGFKRRSAAERFWARYWSNHLIQRVAIALWAVTLLGAIGYSLEQAKTSFAAEQELDDGGAPQDGVSDAAP